jgi:hypothetical protein
MAPLVASRGGRWRSQQMTAGSGAGAAELVVRGEDPDGLPGTPFGQPHSDGFRHLATLVTTGEVDHDVVGADVLVPPISDRWDAVLDGAAGGWWGQLMKAIRSYARGDLERRGASYLRSDQPQVDALGGPRTGAARQRQPDHSRAAELYARAIARHRPACRWVGPQINCWPRVDRPPAWR